MTNAPGNTILETLSTNRALSFFQISLIQQLFAQFIFSSSLKDCILSFSMPDWPFSMCSLILLGVVFSGGTVARNTVFESSPLASHDREDCNANCNKE